MISGSRILNNVIVRNVLGVGALLLAHFLADQVSLVGRTGFNRSSPYLFLLLMYGWIVFHNRVLFERLYIKGRKTSYFCWTMLAMLLSSFNMHYILTTTFEVNYTIPHILSFWLYTVAGLGIYVIYKHVGTKNQALRTSEITKSDQEQAIRPTAAFSCTVDGVSHTIPCENIYFMESLENYVRIISGRKPLIVRMSLKEAEERLPRPPFVRISRSCIVNSAHIQAVNSNSIMVDGHELKVGKVFKRYVEEFLK